MKGRQGPGEAKAPVKRGCWRVIRWRGRLMIMQCRGGPPGGVKKPWGVHSSECMRVSVCVLVSEKGRYTLGEGGREGERERKRERLYF